VSKLLLDDTCYSQFIQHLNQYRLYLWSADNKSPDFTNNDILQGTSDHDIVFLECNVRSNKDMTVKHTLWFQ